MQVDEPITDPIAKLDAQVFALDCKSVATLNQFFIPYPQIRAVH